METAWAAVDGFLYRPREVWAEIDIHFLISPHKFEQDMRTTD